MKKWLDNKIVTRILAVGVVIALGAIVWKVLEPRIALSQAIDDLREGRQPSRAKESLRLREDRGEVVAALKEALDEEGGTVQGKIAILETLESFQETRPVRRAIESPSLSTRRAAAFRSHADPALKDRIRPIVLDWLGDEEADGRDRAALLCGVLRIEEAVPALLRILEERGPDPLVGNALNALTNLEAEGLGPKALAVAQDPALDARVRGAAFDVLGRREDVPQADVQALMIATLRDRRPENNILRNKATGVLQRSQFANEEAWTALREALFDDQERDGPGTTAERNFRWVIQRGCLRALGRTYPLDRYEELLLDRRIYRHPYFAIRVDVATSMGVLRMKKRIALGILAEYLVDEDPSDTTGLVRQEAWLTFWTLTGFRDGVAKPELFREPPRELPDEATKRDYLFSTHHGRAGVSVEQVGAAREYTSDLAAMRTLRQKAQAVIEALGE